MTENMNAEGKCPKCGKYGQLSYDGKLEMQDSGGYYRYTCGNCGFSGREYYNLIFCEHMNEDGSPITEWGGPKP